MICGVRVTVGALIAKNCDWSRSRRRTEGNFFARVGITRGFVCSAPVYGVGLPVKLGSSSQK